MVKVNVRIQRTPELQPGTAVGRSGKKLLIQYRTKKGGEPRERWFAPARYEVLEGDVADLPRYKRVTQPAEQVERTSDGHCTTCGYLMHKAGENHSHLLPVEGK